MAICCGRLVCWHECDDLRPTMSDGIRNRRCTWPRWVRQKWHSVVALCGNFINFYKLFWIVSLWLVDRRVHLIKIQFKTIKDIKRFLTKPTSGRHKPSSNDDWNKNILTLATQHRRTHFITINIIKSNTHSLEHTRRGPTNCPPATSRHHRRYKIKRKRKVYLDMTPYCVWVCNSVFVRIDVWSTSSPSIVIIIGGSQCSSFFSAPLSISSMLGSRNKWILN